MDPIYCSVCSARFPIAHLTAADYCALQDLHYCKSFVQEFRMLQRVKDLYRRHPEAEDRIKPDFPWVKVAEDEDEDDVIDSLELDVNDAAVVDYLKHHEFSLGPRLRFVSEQLDLLNDSVGLVPYPRCKAGRLELDAEHWQDPNGLDN